MMKEVDRCYRQIFWSEEVGGLWKMIQRKRSYMHIGEVSGGGGLAPKLWIMDHVIFFKIEPAFWHLL